MDLQQSGRFDTFCIVSSDSDYTLLATRIREQRLRVIGIGEKKTPKVLVIACNLFMVLPTDFLVIFTRKRSQHSGFSSQNKDIAV